MKNRLLILEDFDYVLESILKVSPQIVDDYEVIRYSKDNEIDQLVKVSKFIRQDVENNRAIIIDDYGILPFMVTAKHEKIICAQLSEEHSALMTRDHNNSNVISIGAMMAGVGVINSVIDRFINHDYAGGRHQIRIDMLDSMGGAK